MPNIPRFLITTADARSWRDDTPLLFLGEWCCWGLKKEELCNLNAEVVPPYGWEEGQKKADYLYVWDLIERLLPELSEMLNRHHGTSHAPRYWRIMLGTWLYKFTMIMFNRWATVQHALGKYSVSGTVVLEFPREQLVPVDYIGFARLYRFDAWNQAVYGRIFKDWSNVSCIVKKTDVLDEGDASDRKHFTPPPTRTLKQQVKRFVANRVQRFANLLTRPTDAFLISTYLPFVQECKLQLALGQIPVPRLLQPTPRVSPDFDIRNNLSLGPAGFTGFEQFIRTLIPEQLPSCYLEGYLALCEKAASMPWPAKPKFIFTSNSFDGDEVFKAWTAAKTELGVPYIIGQHGANYGAGEFAPSEIHEVATADRYLTWGWEEDSAKHRPVAALPMIGKPAGKWNPDGGLLLVERGGGHREPLWDETPAFRKYLEDQFKFVGCLLERVGEEVTVRLYSAYLYANWSEDTMWKDRFPRIQLDDGTAPISEQIRRSRLTVFSYESTGVLESLAGNIPMLLFYDSKNWPLRLQAQPYYHRLMEAGIFHETPESAAEKVNEIWDDVQGWWAQDKVQEARRIFCDHFARMPQHPIRELKKALLDH
ncbi:MAG: LIC12162 family protein [Gallionella sp.]|nr:LIC12162 family protein [Gallionella sp.]